MNERLKISVAMFQLFVLPAAGLVGLVALTIWGWTMFNVWSQSMEGKAKLQRAEYEKQILVSQAKAEVEAAKLQAEAIKTVGQAAKEFPEYRHQEFIRDFGEALKDKAIQKIIFVPTEANVPIVERATDH